MQALASLKVITSGGNIGGTAQGQTWLSRLRRTLADARCNRGYAGMCDAVLRERVGRSFAMHGAQHAPGGLEEGGQGNVRMAWVDPSARRVRALHGRSA
jgi:hypothetical protein